MDNKKDEVFGYNDESCGGCGCGCDHSEDDHREEFDFDDEDDDIMYLTLDDDTELECKVLGIFEVEDKEYIALLPVGEEGEEEDVLLYKYIGNEDDEDFELLLIEDEEEFEIVSQSFYALFVDDDEDDFVEYGSYDDVEDKE